MKNAASRQRVHAGVGAVGVGAAGAAGVVVGLRKVGGVFV